MKKIKEWWRNLTDTKRQAEINRLVTKAGRRLARDLRHCLDEIENPRKREQWRQKHSGWVAIFWDTVDYRDSFHRDIMFLEMEVERLKKQLKAAGIEPETELPF